MGTAFFRRACRRRCGDEVGRWGNKHHNGVSVTSGGRWLAQARTAVALRCSAQSPGRQVDLFLCVTDRWKNM